MCSDSRGAKENTVRLAHALPDFHFTLDLEVLKSLWSPFSFPEVHMTPRYGTFCFATREISIYTTFTDSVVAFRVDFEPKSGMCTRITAANRTLVRS